jgi:hypothetical protein
MHRVAVLLCCAAVAGGCGSDNPRMIPADRASDLIATIDQIPALVEQGQCVEAAAKVAEAKRQVLELPRGVSARLKRNINAWLEHIEKRLPQDCKAPEESPSPTETPTETPEPTETPTPEPTETPTPVPTETATPEPSVTVEPPDPGGVDAEEGT